MTTSSLRQGWENKDRLQTQAADKTALIHSSGRTRSLETGEDIIAGVRPLKFISEQKNIYSRRCGTWDNVTQNLKAQIRIPMGAQIHAKSLKGKLAK